MKKFLCLLSVFAVAGCSVALAGCSSDEAAKGSLGLSCEKKYLFTSHNIDFGDTHAFVLFHKNGSGELCYKQGKNSDQTVSFKYLHYSEEDTVFCFYDSVVYGEDHHSSEIQDSWTRSFLCTEELLYSSNGNVYICEDYLPNLPNFAQKSSE